MTFVTTLGLGGENFSGGEFVGYWCFVIELLSPFSSCFFVYVGFSWEWVGWGWVVGFREKICVAQRRYCFM